MVKYSFANLVTANIKKLQTNYSQLNSRTARAAQRFMFHSFHPLIKRGKILNFLIVTLACHSGMINNGFGHAAARKSYLIASNRFQSIFGVLQTARWRTTRQLLLFMSPNCLTAFFHDGVLRHSEIYWIASSSSSAVYLKQKREKECFTSCRLNPSIICAD